MPRIARIVIPGYPHHIIERGNNKQDVFIDDKDRMKYLYLLQKYSEESDCKIHAFCLMRNHVHLLAVPEDKDSLAKMMQKLSLVYTQYTNKKYTRTGRLWECRYHSSVVDTENYLLNVCVYIERNPVRAKIVDAPDQYRWSSIQYNTGKKTSKFLQPIYKTYVEFDNYVNLVNMNDDENQHKLITERTFLGKPLGNEKFLKKVSDIIGYEIRIGKKGRPRKQLKK